MISKTLSILLCGSVWTVSSCAEPVAGPTAADASPRAVAPQPVELSVTNKTPRIATSHVDSAGKPVSLPCSSCHSVKAPDPKKRRGDQLLHFHQGLTMAQGDLTCVSCHDSRDYDQLRLADLTSVTFPDVMMLCSQCHGPQRRDYDHGAHGGMSGYWDLSRGKRVRNGCTACHDPHAPAFRKMLTAPGPRDRFAAPNTQIGAD